MEDIKRVISFDSVEEFWGYVILRKGLMNNNRRPFQQLIQQYCPAITVTAEGQLLLVQGTRFCQRDV